jgi:hypothetical protein
MELGDLNPAAANTANRKRAEAKRRIEEATRPRVDE